MTETETLDALIAHLERPRLLIVGKYGVIEEIKHFRDKVLGEQNDLLST